MENTKLGTYIVHKDKPELSGELTALKGDINQLRVNKEVELDNEWTGHYLKEFKLIEDY
jgi:hypothetical protein